MCKAVYSIVDQIFKQYGFFIKGIPELSKSQFRRFLIDFSGHKKMTDLEFQKVFNVCGSSRSGKICDSQLSMFIIKISDLDNRIDEDDMEEALEEAR